MTKRKGEQGTKGLRYPSPASPLTDELIDAFIANVKSVFYAKWAIQDLGFSERVLYKWLERGEKELARMEAAGKKKPKASERIYVRLVREMAKAKAANVKAHAINIQRHGLGQAAQYHLDKDGNVIRDASGNPILAQPAIAPDWKASARYLEAVAHSEFGRKIRQELTTPEDGPGGPSELVITVVKKRDVKEPGGADGSVGGDPD